jgi:hypothetical protein
MYDLPYEETVADMRQVVAETLDLIEQHFPDVDTTETCQRVAYARTAHARPVRFGDKNERS